MKKIAILGSAKDHEFLKILATSLENSGFYVFLFPNFKELRQTKLPDIALKLIDKGLIYGGFERIKRSDLVLFANIDGYMGISSTLELGYSAGLSKHIVALNHDKELTRESLFNDVLETEDIDKITKYLSLKFS